MSKKILIIGNSAKVYALAKKISESNEVYVAPGNQTIKEFATCLDIRETSVPELLEFAIENAIDITIPYCDSVLNTELVDLFNKNNLQVFAPSQKISAFLTDKATQKKSLYKLRIPTPKFGIFEKNNMAFDYIKNLKTPFVIKTNEPSSAVVLTSKNVAKSLLDAYFVKSGQKVIIEDYVWGTPFAFYVITDGYKALPIGSSIVYKHSLEGDGGQLTSGMGACSPNYKLSVDNEYFLMDNVVYPLLESFERDGSTYLGILGVQGILTEDGELQVLGVQPYTNDSDTTAILELIDTDFISLIESCVIGSFSDEVDFIPQKDISATSVVLCCNHKDSKENSVQGLDLVDSNITFYPSVIKNRYLEYEAQSGPVLILTSLARTLTSSTSKVYDDIDHVSYQGLYYRKDICKAPNC